MAESPAHKFGQVIGTVVEKTIEPLLQDVAREHGLYLDRQGFRPVRRGKKVNWTNRHGNSHDLDFVLERGGTETVKGTPVAFVETAWRRYTKHSRNKAQEIQGAILPLVETYQNSAPFFGTVLAGVFTGGSLAQLRSLHFNVIYFPYTSVIDAFGRAGIDASFDERTRDAEFARKVRAWERLSADRRLLVATALAESNDDQINEFRRVLSRSVTRRVQSVLVVPLHGANAEWPSVEAAIAFIEHYAESTSPLPLMRYEIEVRYNNGDRIRGEFARKADALEFLRGYTG